MSLMANRLLFHEELVKILGSRNVYFQPPENVKLKYPAIVYSIDNIGTWHADNDPYHHQTRYQVIFIDYDPESDAIDALLSFRMSRFDRHYVSDNLNHYVFTITWK